MVFDVAVTIFFWVQFWSIGWQKFNLDLWMDGKIPFYFLAGMNAGSVPDQNNPAGNMSLQMLEHLNGLFTSHGTFKMAFVDFARQCQSDCRR